MGRLLLINGLPGSGKSTVASRYAADRPLSLCLDVDVVRGMLGGWMADPPEAGLLARRMALAMAREVLADGRDVVVPQFLHRLRFVEELELLAAEYGVPFLEVVLMDTPTRAAERIAVRADGPLTATQYDAHVMFERDGGLESVPDLHRRLIDVLDQRPGTIVVEPVLDDVELTYHAVTTMLDERDPGGS